MNLEPRYVRTPEAAKFTGLSEIHLRKLRVRGNGPKFLKVGKAVLYDLESLESWMNSHECDNTSAFPASGAGLSS